MELERIREQFPIFSRAVNNKPLVYLDNGATTLKPQCVVDTVAEHYLYKTSNVHRGLHYLSEQATAAYEDARSQVKGFLNAESHREIIFTSGTTAAINLVARAFGDKFIHQGDEIIISQMEHHSNIVPWQLLCQRTGAILKVAPINDLGELDIDFFERNVCEKTKLVSLVYASNSLGTINPIKLITQIAKTHGVPVVVDAAQAVSHLPVDVRDLDCDFLAFSGHKIFGPTGIGVLYGKKKQLDRLPPVFGGGEMIKSVTFEKTTYAEPPGKFEAGTPNIVGAIGLGRALRFVSEAGFEKIAALEKELLSYGTEQLSEIPGLTFIGQARDKVGIISFVLKDIHPHDIGTIVDQYGVAIRAGHHCTQPVMQRFNVPATARASFSIYNTRQDIDKLKEALLKVKELFS
jgi:cysteine desulfurase / selenocysteine lyase